jgi:hypothetical protein
LGIPRELRNLTSDLLDFLNTRGTGADDADTFAVDVNVFLRPHCCVEANALELVKTLVGWDVVLPGNAGAKDEVFGLIYIATLGLNVPNACGVIRIRSLNEGVEAIVQETSTRKTRQERIDLRTCNL